MKIGTITFPGNVFGQSGVQGFFGDGDEYPHHAWYKFIPGFSFKGMVFVAKTVTLGPRVYPKTSNTELVGGYRVKDFFPASVWWSIRSIWKGYLLNAIGLANPGLKDMLNFAFWQKRSDSFQLSVMLMGPTLEDKLMEAKLLCEDLRAAFPANRYHYALQVNLSCPNTGHEQTQAEQDIIEILQTFRQELPGVPLVPKFDLLVSPDVIKRLKEYCDAFCIANTLPFNKGEHHSWWERLFKNGISPLPNQLKKGSNTKITDTSRFEGGLSGAPLFPLLLQWLEEMEATDNTVSIIAGGGIMKKADIEKLAQFEVVKGVALGSVAILRPWRLKGLIEYGNQLFSAFEFSAWETS